VVERLGLLDVAARTDAGLLARSGLAQQGPEGVPFGAVGGELIGGGQDGEIALRHPQQEILLCAAKTGLGGGGLKIRLLELTEGLEAPQRLRQVQSQAVHGTVAVLHAGGGAEGTVSRLGTRRLAAVEARA